MTKENKTAQELALDMPDEIWIRRFNDKPTGIEIVFGEVDQPMFKYNRALTPPSDDVVSEALESVISYAETCTMFLEDAGYVGKAQSLGNKCTKARQALQSRAGQEGEVCPRCNYPDDMKCEKSVPFPYVPDNEEQEVINEALLQSVKVVDDAHPSKADAVDVENKSVLISELTKHVCPRAYAKGAVEYLLKKGYLTQKPDDGMVLVPREPTDEMLDIMHNTIRIDVIPKKKEANILNDVEVYKAMIAQHLTED